MKKIIKILVVLPILFLFRFLAGLLMNPDDGMAGKE